MSQEYTPVSWQDETTSQQGTLINAERLNQMQGAHHYADGFEEVDTVPSADPGVDYHKIVYCTADNALYRWDGTQWTADIDDPTRELLEEHEADHDNPHEVTKAQVGLGNADNTSDADKPISTATQTALDTKLTQRFTTLVGREYVYAYTRTQQTAIEAKKGMETSSIPIRDAEGAMHAQVPASPEATNVVNYGWANTELDKKADKATTYTKTETDTLLGGKADKATTLAGYGITDAYTKTEADTLLGAKADQATTYTKTEVQTYVSNALDGYLPMVRTTGNQSISGAKTFTGQMLATGQRAYSAGNTSDVATIGTLDAYTPMVRTTGNQDIGGIKNFQDGVMLKKMNTSREAIPAGYHNQEITHINDANNVYLAQFVLTSNTSAQDPTKRTMYLQVRFYGKNGDTSPLITIAQGDVPGE